MSKQFLSQSALATLLCMMLFIASSCKKGDGNDNTDYEIIEYEGDYPAPENVEYVENGVIYEIEAIPGQVVISTDIDPNTVINAVSANNGKIIEQYPQYGLYTVEVIVGNENAFVVAMNDLNISAELNLVEYPKEKYDYFVFDDYVDANGAQHGRKISNILKECQNDAMINEVNNVIKFIIPLNYTNFLLWDKLLSQNMVLVNWSHNYGKPTDDWQNMTQMEKNNYMIGWKKEVMGKLDQIIRLKKKNPNIDIVFAKAAGNERCPELAQMINDIKANPKYKQVLEENFIIVSDYTDFANSSSMHGDFCFIKEHPYYDQSSGTTSFATPQALCYINQVIKGTVGEDGKNITAVQALAAVKAAIRQNSNGELDLDEAMAMARIMYSPMAHEIIVTPKELTFEAISGGYQVVNVVVNSDNPLPWAAICNESWVHLSVTSGTNDTNVQVSVDNNTSTTARCAIITFTTTGTISVVTVNQAKGSEINGDWVDLGLSSGTLWATRNVGATTPEGYGNYFAWGETQSKTIYNWSTYKYGYLNNEGFIHLTKYNTEPSLGPVDNLTVLQAMDDAATANWGNGWRMPTSGDWSELYHETTSTWTTQNGVKGRLFTANNGRSLFLPAAGHHYGDEFSGAGNYGFYWSSCIRTGSSNAYSFDFSSSDSGGTQDHDTRYHGLCVRPVRSTN